MKRLSMSDSEIRDLSEAIASPETKQRFRRRLLALKMVASGIKRADICSILEISRTTLASYVSDYAEGGIAATMEDRNYRPCSSVDEHLDGIAAMFAKSPPATAKEASAMIEGLCGVRLSASQTRAVMAGRLGMAFRKSGSLPGKADGQMQMDFFSNELEPRLEQARRGEREVYFIDASHFLFGGYPDYCWCRQRQWIRTASGRKRFNVLGALNAVSLRMLRRETEGSVNAETVCALLIDLHNEHARSEALITVVLDNVPYHRARMVRSMAELLGIELLFLPPYSPNLNLIERPWKHIKKRCLSNRHYETFAQFKDAIRKGIDAINGEDAENMKSLLTLKFQMFNL